MDCGPFLQALNDVSFRQQVGVPGQVAASLGASMPGQGVAIALFDPEDRLAFAGDNFRIAYNVPSHTAEAVAIVDRVRCRRTLLAAALQAPRCTMSAGVAGWRRGDCADDLYRRADQALYASKRAGRDRVTADEEPAMVEATAL